MIARFGPLPRPAAPERLDATLAAVAETGRHAVRDLRHLLEDNRFLLEDEL
jgi:hypothetical protein